jgi:hypothetical protein
VNDRIAGVPGRSCSQLSRIGPGQSICKLGKDGEVNVQSDAAADARAAGASTTRA